MSGHRGMIVGEHTCPQERDVNALKAKQLTNIRVAGKHICKGAQRDYENSRAGLIAGICARHERAAKVCTLEEMRPQGGSATDR